MSEERRAFPREIVNCPGSIVAPAGTNDCLIADISEGGVRLFVQSPVPDEFSLVIKDSNDAMHKCRVVWRLDDELGAEFI